MHTLASMIGEIEEVRPRLGRDLYRQFINAAIRMAIDSRTFWSDLLTRGIISIPAAYTTGTVTLTSGSNLMAGTGTAWPTNDVVNTSFAQKVNAHGDYVEIQPGSMAGIVQGGMLWLSGGLATQEAVAVVEVTPTTFYAKCLNPHDHNDPITGSSLAGRQARPATGYPIYTVRAVRDASTIELDNPWGGSTLTDVAYMIWQAYYGIDPNFKEFLAVRDEQTGIPLPWHIPQDALDMRDAQRGATGDPQCLSAHSPSEGGIMQYEIWPHQTGARQLSILYSRAWPELKRDNDRPPWFINPNLFIAAAKAKALMTKKFLNVAGKLVDPYYDPLAAKFYGAEAMDALTAAINADESKALRAYEANYNAIFGIGGANFWQSHDPYLLRGAY